MKNIKEYIINESTEIFRKQDEFLKKMIKCWKENDELKSFDVYFKWKIGELPTKDFKEDSSAIDKMRSEASKLQDKLIEDNKYDDELLAVVDAIELELINIQKSR